MKLNTAFFIAILVIGAVFIVGCSQTPDSATKSESSLYKNTVYGFSIEYPKDWEVRENVNMSGPIAIVVLINNQSKTFVSIATENAPGYALPQYVQASKQSLSQVLGADYASLTEGSLTINNKDAHYLEYSYNTEGYSMKLKQVILMQNAVAYIITFTSMFQNTFEENVVDFDNSVSTFKFI